MTAALHIEDLAFTYPGASAPTVRVARLDLAPGEQMLLTATSGAGKSTLLHLIAGLLEPQSGRVVVAGEDVFARRPAARDLLRGRFIGMIFQTFNLLTGFSALENVMAAMMFSPIPRREHRGRAQALLARLGIERPEAPPEELSVGQQQRVAVARALACEPRLVLADEPTASLDPERAAEAMDLIQHVCREGGVALLCVSHDPAMASRFERRAALADLGRGLGDAAGADAPAKGRA
jgi:putative ABC transport system ATP-binding protein